MAYVAVGVAVAALFTVGSFWWLYARKGSITATSPRAYAFVGGQRQLLLRYPFAFFNDGARALVVVDLRLVLDDEPGQPELRWKTTRDRLRPEAEDGLAYPVPFSVLGRSIREVITEFGPDDDLDWSPPALAPRRLRLQGQIHPKPEWVDLAAFDWYAPPEEIRTAYIAQRNEV